MMNIAKMMKKAQELQSKMESAQQKVAMLEVEGSSGAGLVKLTLTGQYELRALSIDPSLMVESERDMLEDLIKAAYSDAITKLETLKKTEMAQVTDGLDLPSGLKLPF